MQLISQWTPYTTPEGWFRYGSVVGGHPPTPIKAEWLNVIQTELANFVLAYLPALDVDDNEQLLKAAQQMIANLATKATTLAGYGITDAYTKQQADLLLQAKANWGPTLAAYGITDAYTKPQIDSLLSSKANWGITLGAYGIGDAYTKTNVDTLLAAKADKATTLSGYGITDPIWTDLNATPKAIVAQASAEVGGIGTYALLLVGGGTSDYAPVAPGTLVPGGNCLYSNSAASSSSGVPAGTWKVMGALFNRDGNQPDSVTLCLRVS